jgi:hypothetical protein
VTVHVVGAGIAGLAAALALARAGQGVVLHEAAPSAGGRARALPDGTDNGTHALMGANRAALRFLGAIGARAGWVEPEPAGLPVLDLESGAARVVATAPAAWRDAARRPEGLSRGGLLAVLGLALPGPERSVAAAMRGHPGLLRGFVEPLTVAALNTPAVEASSRVLGAVLRRMALPGATRLYVAREGLGPDLVEPAVAALGRAGVRIRFGARLRGLRQAGGRVAALEFGEDAVVLGREDAVVLALPPWEAARVLPGLNVPERHAPILNLHYARPGAGPVRFLGLVGGLAQWVLVRPGGVSVTVSAADAAMVEPTDALAAIAWREVRAAALAFGLPGDWSGGVPPHRVVKERRATPRHGLGRPAPPPLVPVPGVVLAGDWTDGALPATIEAAVRSGELAARLVVRGALRASRGVLAEPARA